MKCVMAQSNDEVFRTSLNKDSPWLISENFAYG